MHEINVAPTKPLITIDVVNQIDVRASTINLEPRSLIGEVSEGMLFDIGYADGITSVLAIPEKPVPNGARAG